MSNTEIIHVRITENRSGIPVRKDETERIRRALREQDERDELLRQRRQTEPAAPQQAHGN